MLNSTQIEKTKTPIRMGPDYAVTSDGVLNIILLKRIETKDGRESWSNKGYFSSVREAVRRFADLELFSTGFSDIKTINNKQNKIYDIINRLDL